MNWKVKYDGGSKHCINCKHSTEDYLKLGVGTCPRTIELGIKNVRDTPIEKCWEANEED